jgi:U3 small nucleolar RNA-associated protein 18
MASLNDRKGKKNNFVANAFDIAIDRTGVEEDDLDEGHDNNSEKEYQNQLEDSDVSDQEVDDGDKPAWQDDDDEKIEVNLLRTSRLRKLRLSRDEPAAEALSGVDFTHRLRDRYISTVQRTVRTDWAESTEVIDGKTVDEGDFKDDTDASFLRVSSRRLPPGLLNVVRCPDANQSDPNNAVVQSVHFHPCSEPDRPLMLTAGLDKTLRFFQVGAEESVKVHGIHCKFYYFSI